MYEMNYSRKQDFIPPFFYSLLFRNNKICLPLMDLRLWQAASNSILLGTELRNKIQKEVKSTREVPGREKSIFFFQKEFKLPFNKALLKRLPGDTLTQSHPGSRTYSKDTAEVSQVWGEKASLFSFRGLWLAQDHSFLVISVDICNLKM